MERIEVNALWEGKRKLQMREPNRKILLRFPNGEEVECYYREAILSLFIWRIFFEYPEIELKPSYMIRAPINQKTIGKTFEKILEENHETFERLGISHDYLAEIYSKDNNLIFNAVTTQLTSYITSASGPDLREIIHHPKMEEIYRELKSNHGSLKAGYKSAMKVMTEDPVFRHNAFIRGLKVGTINKDQFLHVVLARGTATDINYKQFPDMILAGYGRGIHNTAWSAQESRDACIAALQAKAPVQKSDYLNRRLQINTAPIRYIFKGDCGTKETIPWFIGENDLTSAIGVNYINEEGKLKTITKNSTELIGKYVNIRAAPVCHKLHEYGVCETCLGKVSRQIPQNYAIGHISVIAALGAFVQLSLSAKHLIVSRESVTFVLSPEAAKVLDFPRRDEKNTLVVKPTIINKGHEVEFIFSTKDLHFLGDIANGIRGEDIQVSMASTIDEVMAAIRPKGKTDNEQRLNFSVADIGRKSFLSREFIDYIINNQDQLEVKRNLASINLSKWDPKLPMFNIPLKITGVSDFMKNFENTILYGTTKYNLDANNPVAISDMMRLCYNIVRECVEISVPHLGVMISSLLIRDSQALDYRLPLPGGNRQFSALGNLCAYRSLSQAMAYERRIDYFASPAVTLVKLRLNHSFDALYFPQSVDAYEDVKRARRLGLYPDEVLPIK